MPVMMVQKGPTLTAERYEEAVRRLTGGKPRLEAFSDWPVAGILSHATGQSADGFVVVDVWESEEAFASFGEKLGPILQDVGIEDPPELFPAHTFVSS